MASHRKPGKPTTASRTYNGKKWEELTDEEKVQEMNSSIGNPKQYASDNFTELKTHEGKHKKD